MPTHPLSLFMFVALVGSAGSVLKSIAESSSPIHTTKCFEKLLSDINVKMPSAPPYVGFRPLETASVKKIG